MRRVAPLAVLLAVWVAFVVWVAPIALVLGLPWAAATAWAVYRHGWEVLIPWGGSQRAQARDYRAFRGGV